MFDDIIKHVPKDAQWRINEYVQCTMEEETLEDLPSKYGVKDAREMASHLAQYECGQRYLAEDKLIKDYKKFWEVLGKMFGEEMPSGIPTGLTVSTISVGLNHRNTGLEVNNHGIGL